MAMYIEISDGNSIEWHTGDVLPVIWQSTNANIKRHVVEVQADGDELEYIRLRFTNLRMSLGRVVVWTGDDAKFIHNNLSESVEG